MDPRAFAAVGELLQTLVMLLPQRETLNRIAERVASLMEFKACAILMPTPDGRQMRVEGNCNFPGNYLQQLNGPRAVRLGQGELSESPSARAFATGEPAVIPDVTVNDGFKRWRALAERHGFRAIVSVPLLLRGTAIGVLNGYSERPRDFRKEELDFLIAVAAQASLVIELARRLDDQTRTIQALEDAASKLEAQRVLLERSGEIHRHLSEIVLAGAGVDAIALTLARLAGNPVVAWTRAGTLICAARPDQPGLGEEARAAAWFALPRVQRRLSSLRRGSDPVVVRARPDEGLRWNLVIAPIAAGEEQMGYVGLIEAHRAAGELDLRALQHGAAVLALELTKRKVIAETEARLKGDFVHDLLMGAYDREATIAARARVHGCDLSRPHRVLVADIDAFGEYVARRKLSEVEIARLRGGALAAAREALALHAPGSLLTMISDRIMAICPTSAGQATLPQVGESVQARIRAVAPGLTASVAFGGPCASAREFTRSYREARECLRLVRQMGLRERLVCVEDLGIFRTLLFNVRNPRALAREAGGILRRVMEHDRARRTDLLRSLEVYLDHRCELAAAARALHVHPNTLKYRLHRVAELTGRDPRNPYDLLQLALAVVTLRVPQDSDERPEVEPGAGAWRPADA